MNQEKALEWANRLDSGKYLQGKNGLNVDGRYCCLGVACEMAVEAGVIPRGTRIGGFMEYGIGDNSSTAVLPPAVREWLEMDSSNGYIGGGDYTGCELTVLNDNDTEVPRLAVIIREHWEWL